MFIKTVVDFKLSLARLAKILKLFEFKRLSARFSIKALFGLTMTTSGNEYLLIPSESSIILTYKKILYESVIGPFGS